MAAKKILIGSFRFRRWCWSAYRSWEWDVNQKAQKSFACKENGCLASYPGSGDEEHFWMRKYSGLNLNQDKATKPQAVQIVRQGEATPYWFKVNPLYRIYCLNISNNERSSENQFFRRPFMLKLQTNVDYPSNPQFAVFRRPWVLKRLSETLVLLR